MQVFAPFITKRNNIAVRVVALLIPVVMMLMPLTQTVFAENTFVITDGEEVTVCTVYSDDPAEALAEAGVLLNDGDAYTTSEDDGQTQINIKRIQNITIYYCGDVLEETSFGETLEEMLIRLGITLDETYVVSLPLDTQTFDGMEVRIDQKVSVKEVYTEDTPYETTYCYAPNLPEGEEKEMVAGVVGQIRYTANVEYFNGEETNREVVKKKVIQKPQDRIVLVGTGVSASEDAPAIGNGVIVTADGEVLAYKEVLKFKSTAYNHADAGCDMTTATGTTVRKGTVAVDPTVIPYGTRMFIVSADGKFVYGIATAEDCGGGVKGDHIDLYYPDLDDCWQYGRRNAMVYILD